LQKCSVPDNFSMPVEASAESLRSAPTTGLLKRAALGFKGKTAGSRI
jgi:hypothetical protein